MKKLILAPAILACFASMAFVLYPRHTEVFKLDTQTSTLLWKGKKLTGEHSGTIGFSGGELRDNHGAISGKFDVDMKSITVTDLQGDSKAKLESHLKSDDFFAVDKFPTASFAITSLVRVGDNAEGNTHTVSGNLTIRDKTNPVSFNAKFADEGTKLRFTGTAVIDRTKYDVKFRSKTFYPDVGDKVIDDEFTLVFSVALIKGTH